MPIRVRPVREIKGTSLISALDVQEVRDLFRLAAAQVRSEDARTSERTRTYATGVRDLLAWLDGAEPSVTLAKLLKIDRPKEERDGRS